MGGYWVPTYLDRVATQATPASLGGAKGKAEAAGCPRGELTTPGLSKDRAPKLQAKAVPVKLLTGEVLGTGGGGRPCRLHKKYLPLCFIFLFSH